MITLKDAADSVLPLLAVAVMLPYGNTAILRGLPSGPHAIRIDLVDANHQPVDTGTVRFDVPQAVAVPGGH